MPLSKCISFLTIYYAFVDWYKVRVDERLVLSLVGCLPRLGRQLRLGGLPASLSREETTLLLEMGLATLTRYSDALPSSQLATSYHEETERINREQVPKSCFPRASSLVLNMIF